MSLSAGRTLWLRWVFANAMAELIGLGATFGIGFLLFPGMDEPESLWVMIGLALLMVLSGAVEGTVVGLAQWWALHPYFERISRRSWAIATLMGALTAWFLGSIPSVVMSLMEQGTDIPMQEPETWFVMLMTSSMGAVLGIVLAFFQWRVLRKRVAKAWLWLPANSAAWALGMPIIFAAVDIAQKTGGLAMGGLVMAVGLALTGAMVGAVHGVVLVRLAHLSQGGNQNLSS